MSAASASDSAAKAPMVSMPSRCSFSSATGPMPHSRRTGRPCSRTLSSSRRTTRTPSGLASPEAILAICFPDPAPTEATSPVSWRTLARSAWQKASTSLRVGARQARVVRRRLRRRRVVRGRERRCGRCRARGGWPRRRPLRAAAAPRPGRRPGGAPGALASPTGPRTREPRSWPRRQRRARPARRQARAGRAGWAGSTARRTHEERVHVEVQHPAVQCRHRMDPTRRQNLWRASA